MRRAVPPKASAPGAFLPAADLPADATPNAASARLARNIGALTIARGITMAMTLVTTGVVARVVEPGGLGVLSFSGAFVGYFALAGTLGLDLLGMRELARRPADLQTIVRDVVSLRLALHAVALVAYVIAVWALPRGPEVKAVLFVQGLTLVGQAISLEWVYQGTERMGVVAVRNVVAGALQLAATLVLVREADDVVWAAAAQTGAVLLVGVGLWASYRRDFGLLALHVNLARWKSLAREAVPFAASVLMIAVYYQIDKVLLSVLRNDVETGLYEAAYRIAAMALVPVQVLGQAFYPTLSAAFGDASRMRSTAEGYVRVNLGIGLPVAFGCGLLARPLLGLIAGPAYGSATVPLVVLTANIAVTCLSMGYSHPLLAWNRQRLYLGIMGLGAAVNVALNLLLIPAHGPLGAAWSALGSGLAVLAAVLVAHYRLTGRVYASATARVVLATAVGVGCVVLGAQALGAPWPVQVLTAMAAYPAAAMAFGVVRPAELRGWRTR